MTAETISREHEKLQSLSTSYQTVRGFTKSLFHDLEPEDCVIQSMPDVSPTRWHLAHTTWFFETFLLKPFCPSYRPANTAFEYLFNSYYNTVGDQYPRAKRGLLSRPTVNEIWRYREAVDESMLAWLPKLDSGLMEQVAPILELGVHHEQQHQELMLTDIKHVFSCNPLFPIFRELARQLEESRLPDLEWLEFEAGVNEIGHSSDGFCYDNELPRHRVFLQPYRLANRLVTNGEYLEFIEAGGYANPAYWLSAGWATVQAGQWKHPLYWSRRGGNWCEFTLSGLKDLNLEQPVCHVGYFEADAFARWKGKRLPTEFEWEHAATRFGRNGAFVESEQFHPQIARKSDSRELSQAFGDCWEWTASHYSPYPGYQAPEGALGEYNGKFMCNQFVLRGGSAFTSASHMRTTYRNFFPSDARWQLTGIRLAES